MGSFFLWHQLYQNGHLVDEYNSCSGCLDPAQAPGPIGGDASKLCTLRGGSDGPAIESIVQAET